MPDKDRATMRRARFGVEPVPGLRPRRQEVRQIQVTPAVSPTARSAARTALSTVIPDPVAVAISDGFGRLEVLASEISGRIEAQLADVRSAVRQAAGIDAADEELDQLRQENARLTDELAHAVHQVDELRKILATPAEPVVPQAG